MNFSKNITWLLHLTAWVFYLLSPFLLIPNIFLQTVFNNGFFIIKLAEDVLIIVFFYANYLYFTPQLLRHGKQMRFWFTILSCFLGICLFSFIVGQYYLKPEIMLPPAGMINNNNLMPMAQGMPLPILPNIFKVIPVFIFATLISSFLVIIKDRLTIKEQKQQIMLEKIATELKVLKLQISPHFLFNTLNNIRWLARQKSDKTEETIVKLSSLLRYILYETKAEKVPLKNEIKNLEDYITLQKIRLTDLTTVDFKITGNNTNHYIEPLLLIPFVENAFKYGVHNQLKSTIEISINTEEKKMVFQTKNLIFEDIQKTTGDDSGIGINNVAHRLKMVYPDNHNLQISDQSGIYWVTLEITFQK